MKEFNSSALSHKRSEVIEAARDGGAIIQIKETNGKVRESFALVPCVLTEDDGYEFVHTKGAIFGNRAVEVFKPMDFKGGLDE